MQHRALTALKSWAIGLRRDAIALWIAARDPRVAWPAKIVAALTAAYAFSPIDLIPDFIPILGLVDDLVIIPLGIWIALRLIPPALMAQFRVIAQQRAAPVSRIAAWVIVVLWMLAGGTAGWWIYHRGSQ